jgi:hypothetical protein
LDDFARVRRLEEHAAIAALFALRRIEEGIALIDEGRRRFSAGGCLYPLVGSNATLGVFKVLQGNIGGGIRRIEEEIVEQEEKGCRGHADSCRLVLAQTYLQIITANQKMSLLVYLTNMLALLTVRITGTARIHALMAQVGENTQWDPAGHFGGRTHMILGLLYKAKKKRALAIRHLTQAEQILSQFGKTPMLAQVDAALAELRQ